ncbi:MAG: hypothetical protein ACRDSP_14375 [Pseudonocardiaceae bacterium]
MGWPITQRGDQISLNLDVDSGAVALVIPPIMSAEVADILVRQRCPPMCARRAALLAVPRHQFLPAQIWVDDDRGEPQPINRDDDPDRWLANAYGNVPILTQFDDGRTGWPDASGELCTSSASKPDLVLTMLAALDVQEGHTVLEIGTRDRVQRRAAGRTPGVRQGHHGRDRPWAGRGCPRRIGRHRVPGGRGQR